MASEQRQNDLSDYLMTQFEMFPNFHRPINNPDQRILSIKFLPSGDNLIAATNKRTIELYNCNTARQEKLIGVYKHGISVVDVLDTDDSILIGSIAVKGDYAVRELNMTTNKYTQQYVGHRAACASLAVNCEKQYFVSGGWDKSVLVFDFRIQSPQVSCCDLPSVPMVALHPTADICGVAIDDSLIELMDLRFMNGPFCRFKLNSDVKWTHFKFSPNGQQMLISSNGTKIRVINSLNGAIQEVFGSKLAHLEFSFTLKLLNDYHLMEEFIFRIVFRYLGRKNTLNIPIDASFTPNSDYILSGSSDGNVLVFTNNKKDQNRSSDNGSVDRERKVAELQSMQKESITAVEMSAKYTMMVTASSYVAFWTPNSNLMEIEN